MNPPPPYFPPFHPPRPPPTYNPLSPPPPPNVAPYSVHPFDLPNEASSSSSSSSTTGGSAPASDLTTALSTLTSLLHLARTTLNSLSPLLPAPSNSSASLLACPFNRNHLVPASSLFSHYLSCPSSSTPLSADDFLHSLSYPHTLHSSATTSSTQPLENSNSAELCFSLENFLNFSDNFFYSDCPAPVIVNSSDDDSLYSPPVLKLPEILYAECANFACDSGCTDLIGFSVESFRLLPSEIWAVREELNGWGDYPASYSHRVLRAILMSGASSLLSLPKWVIMDSSKFGVIIDLAMRDHIVLLFELCFKAVFREVTKLASSLFTGEGEEELSKDKRAWSCPVLSSVMRWLCFHLSMLYGERNGKFFTINMLKQCVLHSALSSSVLPLVEKTNESPELKGVDGRLERTVEKIEGDKPKIVKNGKDVHNSTVSVSQVAAAVAALHERSRLERKIKALRGLPPLTAYQRVVEHEYISKRANDERQKRSNYRPVMEHDGLLFQRSQNLEPNRIKTREELLAEERDYKRRRMSYRGKKMKRSTTQVMRDIINEYMEEIEQGSNVAKGAEVVESGTSMHDSSLEVAKSEKNQSTFGASSVDSHGYGNQLQFRDHRSIDFAQKYLGDNKKHRHGSWQHPGLPENDRSKGARNYRGDHFRSLDQQHSRSDKNINRARHDRDEYSRSPDKRRSGSHPEGHRASQGNRNDPQITKEKLPRSSDRSRSVSYRQNSHHRDENEHNSERGDRRTKKRHRDSRSASSPGEFDDRYTPSESHDTYEDDV